MIVVICDSCREELQTPGGLLFGVPDADGNVIKYHLCPHCTESVIEYIGSNEGD